MARSRVGQGRSGALLAACARKVLTHYRLNHACMKDTGEPWTSREKSCIFAPYLGIGFGYALLFVLYMYPFVQADLYDAAEKVHEANKASTPLTA